MIVTIYVFVNTEPGCEPFAFTDKKKAREFFQAGENQYWYTGWVISVSPIRIKVYPYKTGEDNK